MELKLHFEDMMISPEMLRLIAEIDEFKGAWKALGALAPERLSALRHVAAIESIGSSTRIEGSLLTDREVGQLLSDLKIRSFSTRDEQEVAGYAEVMELIFQSWPEIALTENHIKQLHRDLLQYSSKDTRHRGHYKTLSNNVAAFDENGKQIGIVFETASPFETPRLMQELVIWTDKALRETRDPLHPLLIVGIFTVAFLAIHPFQDGNGRLSRILTTLLLLRSGYAHVPYSSLENVIERNKEAYYLSLRKTQRSLQDRTADWNPWLLFFLHSVQRQVHNLKKKMEYEKMLFESLPGLSLKIVEFVREHGRGSMKEILLATGANRNSIKVHLRQLVAKKHLLMHGHGRNVWYSLY